MSTGKGIPSFVTPIRKDLEPEVSDDSPDDQEQAAEPAPVGHISPPDEISDEAREWFRFYADQADGIRRYTQGDAQGLAMLSESTADYWRHTQELRDLPAGTAVKDRWIIESQRSVAAKRVEGFLKEFGLTWKSRGNK